MQIIEKRLQQKAPKKNRVHRMKIALNKKRAIFQPNRAFEHPSGSIIAHMKERFASSTPKHIKRYPRPKEAKRTPWEKVYR